ncbi:MAG: type I 3-dehydroquinate dehydratase [Deltaproteobacteria bacterium]|nr:type I 3-dehydroquinate dehydratase [Deltaproteobacteria bacterium]
MAVKMTDPRYPRICISITAGTTQEALIKMEAGFAQTDMLELRIDGLRRVDLKRLLADKKGEILVTNRVKKEGGAFTGNEEARVDLLKEAVALGADYVDLELGTDRDLIADLKKKIEAHQGKTKLILSYHNQEGTPPREALQKILEEGCRAGADIIKIVPWAVEVGDNLTVLDLIPYAKRLGTEIITFCMGEKGKISRAIAPLLGSYLTYAALTKGEESAPGQMTVQELKQIFALIKF